MKKIKFHLIIILLFTILSLRVNAQEKMSDWGEWSPHPIYKQISSRMKYTFNFDKNNNINDLILFIQFKNDYPFEVQFKRIIVPLFYDNLEIYKDPDVIIDGYKGWKPTVIGAKKISEATPIKIENITDSEFKDFSTDYFLHVKEFFNVKERKYLSINEELLQPIEDYNIILNPGRTKNKTEIERDKMIAKDKDIQKDISANNVFQSASKPLTKIAEKRYSDYRTSFSDFKTHYGLLAGVALGKLDDKDESIQKKYNTNINLALFITQDLARNLGIRMNLGYSAEGGIFQQNQSQKTYNLKHVYSDLLLNFPFIKNTFSIFAGVNGRYTISATGKNRDDKQTFDLKKLYNNNVTRFNDFTYGLKGGVKLKLTDFTFIEGSYFYPLKPVIEGGDYKMNQTSIYGAFVVEF